MAGDKRRAKREGHDSVVEIFERGVLMGTGRLADYSSTGIAFASEEEFEKGEKVEARVRMLGHGVLDVMGEIVWRRPAKKGSLYGMRFDAVQKLRRSGDGLW